MTPLRQHLDRALHDRDAATVIGLALSAVWLGLVAIFWLFGPRGEGGASGLARLTGLVGTVMPLVLIWLAVGLARAIATLRAEAEDLRDKLQRMREMAEPRPQRPAAAPSATVPSIGPSAGPLVAAAAPAQRPAAPAAAPRPLRPGDARQTAMRFEGPEPVPVAPTTLIRALDFPDGPEDRDGIEALRAALRDHDSARVLRAAQDVVTLLAGNDIYLDHLPPDPAPPAVWRRFAEGARGSAVAALGGIHDPTALGIVTQMLRSDEIFRDAAHHFLRHFDLALTRFLPQIEDAQLADLGQTRSARAFMLIGRAAGVFG